MTTEFDPNFWKRTSDLWVVVGFDGTIRQLNPAWQEVLGYCTEQLLGRAYSELVHPDDRPAITRLAGPGQQLSRTRCIETRCRHSDGSYRWLQWSSVPYPEEAVVCAVARDVTLEKAHHRALDDMLRVLSEAQNDYIEGVPTRQLFDNMLTHLLRLTGSEYGFIGEVLHDEDGPPYLKTHAMTNIAWNDETRAFYEEHAPNGLEFRNLSTLFGSVIRTGRRVIANEPASDPRRGGTPPGHPPLNAFMGLPFYKGGEMIGNVGIANREGGYDVELAEHLKPFLATCANLISAHRAERRRQASEERYRAVVETALDALLTTSSDGTIEGVNAAAERMFAMPASELIGRDLPQLLRVRSANQQGYLPVPGRSLVTGRRADHTFAAEAAVSEMQLGDTPAYTVLVRDLTAEQRANRLRSELLSTVNHELRTPLASIRGSLGLLSAKAVGDLPARADKLVAVAVRNADRLGRLVDDILDLEALQEGRLDVAEGPLDLVELAREALESSQGLATSAQVSQRLRSAVDVLPIRGDGDRLIQVILNLLSNAVKVSTAGSEVEVTVDLQGSAAVLTVADRGPGVPESFVGRLFEPFSQADASDARKLSGTGLGLSIAQSIAHRHGGQLQYTPRAGGGAQFALRLPAAAGTSQSQGVA